MCTSYSWMHRSVKTRFPNTAKTSRIYHGRGILEARRLSDWKGYGKWNCPGQRIYPELTTDGHGNIVDVRRTCQNAWGFLHTENTTDYEENLHGFTAKYTPCQRHAHEKGGRLETPGRRGHKSGGRQSLNHSQKFPSNLHSQAYRRPNTQQWLSPNPTASPGIPPSPSPCHSPKPTTSSTGSPI